MNPTARLAFFQGYERWHQRMVEQVTGIEALQERHDYVFKLFSRLLFAYFLQEKQLLDHNPRYLQQKLDYCARAGLPFHTFLNWLFTVGFGTPARLREPTLSPLLGSIPYLRLFPEAVLPISPTITLPDQIFEDILACLEQHAWCLDERGDAGRAEVTPALLGHLVERFLTMTAPIQRKETGSYYTPEDVCQYITAQTCEPVVLQRCAQLCGHAATTLDQFLDTMNAMEAGLLLFVVLPTLSVLDPSSGAGNFLLVALEQLSESYLTILERIEQCAHLRHPALFNWVRAVEKSGQSRSYVIKRRVMTRNLFGVDIQQPPLDIAKLRLALALLFEVRTGDEIIPLPCLDFSLRRGNALIGVDRIGERERIILDRDYPYYDTLVAEYAALVSCYHLAYDDPRAASAISQQIQTCRAKAYTCLNAVLVEQINAGPHHKHNDASPFQLSHLEAEEPFHWAFDFAETMAPWWSRCDPSEALVAPVDGKAGRFRIRFGGVR